MHFPQLFLRLLLLLPLLCFICIHLRRYFLRAVLVFLLRALYAWSFFSKSHSFCSFFYFIFFLIYNLANNMCISAFEQRLSRRHHHHRRRRRHRCPKRSRCTEINHPVLIVLLDPAQKSGWVSYVNACQECAVVLRVSSSNVTRTSRHPSPSPRTCKTMTKHTQ